MDSNQRPLKRFGQNFLNNPYIRQEIVNAINISSDDVVVEIGPGKGALTELVIKASPADFVAVEIDKRMSDYITELFPAGVRILNQDFMTLDLPQLSEQSGRKLKILGNIPYNITSPILFSLIDNHQSVDSAVLMTQKEVAKRIVSPPGSKEYGILSVICQTYSRLEYLFDVKRGNFFPIPNVDSAVFKMEFINTIPDIDNLTLFRNLVRGTFNYRRKMLRNSLCRIFDKSIVYSLEAVNLDSRPENLTIAEFKKLSNELNHKLNQDYG
ncbi:MAG: 16S rRNA (adenine(1518)-N(6)/adenine(1519)-N(6))-dimethyltransferase RsmA [Calditrichaceae bacterium]